MNDRKLRRKCEARLRALGLPEQFDLVTLRTILETRRRRPIHFQATTFPRPLSGIWLTRDDTEYILYEENTTAPLQLQIVLHELSHMICGHRARLRVDDVAGASFEVDPHEAQVQTQLQRSIYSEEDEREAEIQATLLLERMTGSILPADAAKLEASFGDDRA